MQNKPQSLVRYVTVDTDDTGMRVDNFLMSQLKGVPRSLIYRIIRKGEVRINKKRIKTAYTSKCWGYCSNSAHQV